jgi:hypothetical protein
MRIQWGERWIQRLMLGLGALVLLAPMSGQAQMTMPGQFGVSPSGAATYSIPIQVPQGVAGIEPKLALVYNSQAGNGLLGMGWSLAGLSSITRCPRTMAQDGVLGALRYDNSDRYCLDGQRLIAVSGTDGANGTQYRTEQDQYSKIVSYVAAGTSSGPTSFVVQTKSGLTLEYGGTADSRIEAIKAPGATATWPAGTIDIWAQSKVIDKQGNYLTLSYDKNASTGAFAPLRIDYTGNAGQSLSPTASVRFIPTSTVRSDVSTLYLAGAVRSTSKRIGNIQTYIGAHLVKDYRLAYAAQSGGQTPSKITAITECDGRGNCLPSMSLNWGGQPAYSPLSLARGQFFQGHPYGTPGWVIPFDFDGDGLQDVAIFNKTSDRWYTIARNNGDGTFTKVAQGQNFLGFPYGDPQSTATIIVVDFNGDGKQDLLFLNSSSDGWYMLAKSNGDGTFTSVAKNQFFLGHPYGTPGWVIPFDFNGDGLTDLAIFNSSSDRWYTIARNNGDGTFTKIAQGQNFLGFPYGDPQSTAIITPMDYDGDGKQDLLFLNSSSDGTFMFAKGYGDGTFSNAIKGQFFLGHPYGTPGWVVPFDFNGDGLPDLAIFNSSSDRWYTIAANNGDGTFVKVAQAQNFMGFPYGSPQSTFPIISTDINYDGKSDLAFFNSSSDRWYMFALSNGDGTFTSVAQTQNFLGFPYGSPQSTVTVTPFDFLGDGRVGIMMINDSSDGWYQFAQLYDKPNGNSITSITNGVGLTIGINTLPLTNKLIYSKSPIASTYPVMDLQYPMYVVSGVTQSNGVAGTRASSYTYGGLKASMGSAGRGALGFQWTQTQDASTGLATRTCYRQDWPYIGLVDKAMTATSATGLPACNAFAGYNDLTPLTASGSGLLSLTLNAYKFNAYPSSDTAYTSPVTCADDPSTGKTSASCPASATAAGNRYQAYAFQSLTQSRDWDGTNFIALPATRTTMTQDNLGNATQIKAETLNADRTASGYSKTTTNTYMAPDMSNWLLGRLQKSSVQAVSP